MPAPRSLLFGPWRAVGVLGITQILAWGALVYPTVLTLPLVAVERGWSISFTMGGFSVALLVGGLVAPRIGRLIDRYGGHVVMPVGSLVGALGLLTLVSVAHPAAYLAIWALLGVAMAASLYDPAFATLGRIFGAQARSPITMLTLAGGFASTVSWPVTHLLIGAGGWRGVYLVYAALLALVAAPLHAFALPRVRANPHVAPQGTASVPTAVVPARGLVFVVMIAAFTAYAFVPSALGAHLLALFERSGLDAVTAVSIGMAFGPAQVLARIGEFALARHTHPLNVARFAVALLVVAFGLLALLGLSTATALAFTVMFGAANGLLTIARGTVPLALFGPVGYGDTIGRIAGPSLLMQAVAPVAFAFVAERTSDASGLGAVALLAIVALACFMMIRRPSGSAPTI